MSYAGVSLPNSGLGLDVAYHSDKTGQDGTAQVGVGPNCGDPYGLQTMLLLLDFEPGPVDGAVGPQTRAALVSYGLSRGVPYDPSTTPQGVICAALIADYQAKFGGGAPPPDSGGCPDGQWGIPPMCFGTETAPPQSGDCPEGTYGLPPYCVAVPGSTPTSPPATAALCPEGTVGTPPNCYGLPPGIPALPGLPGMPPKPTTPVTTTPPVIVNEVPPKPVAVAPPKPGAAAWWGQRSGTEKIVVAGAGVAVSLGALSLLLKKKKPSLPAARSNRR